MTDDLKTLKDALKAATPPVDARIKAAHLARAQENFNALQESTAAARPISNRPKRGLWTGVVTMLKSMTSPAALTASTAFAALGLAVFVSWEGQIPADRVFDGFLEGDDTEVFADPIIEAPVPAADSIQTLAPAVEPQIPAAQSRAKRAQLLESTPQATVLGATSGLSQQPIEFEQRIAPLEGTNDIRVEGRDRDAFSNAPTNPLKITVDDPVSTFSVDVDTASYAIVRRSLMAGQLPNPDAVRVEEMINYFSYDYPAPEEGAFRPSVSVTETPWNPDTQLVQIGIQGALPEVEARPPLNLVFLIDTSGSMQNPDKLPLLKQSFRLMLTALRPEDQVAIVTYAGSAGQVLAPTAASDPSTILAALDELDAGGSTAGQAGLQQAYALAEQMTEDGDVSRVILATDGDFNVGLSDPDALKSYIAGKRESGTYLSVLGFGRGNLQDATMQALAQNGNGQAAYIDTLSEAQKVLVDQLSGALFPIADDVKIQVEFNPAQIAEYRLIGYETRALRREDFNNDAVDAGDIGAGHSVTAMYEVTPVGSAAQLTRPLRYGTQTDLVGGDELGFVSVRYKAPGAGQSEVIEMPIVTSEDADAGFAAAIGGFGQLLRGNPYVSGWSYQEAILLAEQSRGADRFGYRAEAIRLMRLAQGLSDK